MVDREPLPQFSVGFDFDDPLVDLEADRPVSDTTAFALGLTCLQVEKYDTEIRNPNTGVTQRANYFWLNDGTITLVEYVIGDGDNTQIDEQVICFSIVDPTTYRRSYRFDIVLGRLPDGSVEATVEDNGITDEESMGEEGQLFADAVELNTLARLDEVPDTLPAERNDGTLRSDLVNEEFVSAANAALVEVFTELVTVKTHTEPLSEDEMPKRILLLGERFAQKVIDILDPIINTRLDVDLGSE